MLSVALDQVKIADIGAMLTRVPQSNLLQSWEYASAIYQLKGKKPHIGVISWEGKEVGFFLFFEQRHLRLFRRISIERGPLWFSDKIADAYVQAFFLWLNKNYPRRPWQSRWILPELPAGAHYHSLLTQAGWKKAGQSYQSIWLDISPDEAALRSGLKSGWRSALKQAEKASLTLERNDDFKALPWLLEHYNVDKAIRNYKGPSVPLLVKLWKSHKDKNQLLLLRAIKDNEPVAGVLIFTHGSAATYQVGWANVEGRKSSATHYLLWQAIRLLKEKNIRWFDLGGITDDNPGLEEFKSGLGGEKYELIGSYN